MRILDTYCPSTPNLRQIYARGLKNPHRMGIIRDMVPPARIELATDPYHGSIMPFN